MLRPKSISMRSRAVILPFSCKEFVSESVRSSNRNRRKCGVAVITWEHNETEGSFFKTPKTLQWHDENNQRLLVQEMDKLTETQEGLSKWVESAIPVTKN